MGVKIFLDLDGVLADFVGGALAFHGVCLPYHEIRWDFMGQVGIPASDFWTPLGETFWANLQPTVECHRILAAAESRFGQNNVHLLTSPSLSPEAAVGKARWVGRVLGGTYHTRMHLCSDKDVIARPGYVLVDDADHNTTAWRNAGGMAVLVPRPWNELWGVSRSGCVATFVENCIRDL